jgi:putative serine protease PepD
MDEARATGPKPKWLSRPHRASGADRAEENPPAEPHGDSRYGTPPHDAPGPRPPAQPVDPAPATLPQGVRPPPPPSVAPQPPQRYDPWAAPHSLLPMPPVADGGNGAGGGGRKAVVVGAMLLALCAGTVGGAVGMRIERAGGIGEVALPQASARNPARAGDSIAGIAAAALPGVVTLHVRGGESLGTGTGFVLDERGHILTNHHVVGPAGGDGRIQVTFNDGETASGRVIGRDSGYDLAVVKVDGVSALEPLPLGNSGSVRVGDPVVAIGSPFDLVGTVTAGIISAKGRPITAGGERDGSDISYVDALQTDAPINPGNSGGPLMDANGRVIGINSAMRAADQGTGTPEGGYSGSIGLGFAIPVNQGKRVAEELINTGRATHPMIGVSVDIGYPGDGARVGTGGSRSGNGPAVLPGGPADRAGIEEGDIITAVDGTRVRTGEELIVKIRGHRPGDRLELAVERDGKERSTQVTLGTASGE